MRWSAGAVPLAELDLDGAAGAARRAVVEAFVARRLLAVDGDRLEVAHEALLTAWPRLARWLEDDAVGRAVRRHLAPAALEWDARGRPDDELYRGARLAAGAGLGGRRRRGPDPGRSASSSKHRGRRPRPSCGRPSGPSRGGGRRGPAGWRPGWPPYSSLALVAAGLAVRFQRNADARAAEADAAGVADANRLAALSTTARVAGPVAAARRPGGAPRGHPGDRRTGCWPRWSSTGGPCGPSAGGHGSDAALAGRGRTLFMTVRAAARVVTWPVGATAEPQAVFDPDPDNIAASPTGDLVAPVVRRRAGPGSRPRRPWVLAPRVDLGGAPVDIAFSPDGRAAGRAGHGHRAHGASADLASGEWRTIDAAVRHRRDASSRPFTEDASAVVVWTQEDHPGPPGRPGRNPDPAERCPRAGRAWGSWHSRRAPRSCGRTAA